MSQPRKRWAEVYERCAPPLTAFVQRLCGDPHLARAIARRTLLRSLVAWRDLRDGQALELRLRGRAAVALARRERVRRVLPGPPNQAEGASPSEDLLRRWLRLPVTRRAILTLLYVEERTIGEVAIALDRSEGAVRAAAALASRRLGHPDVDQGEGLRETLARFGRGPSRTPDPAPRWTGWQRGTSALVCLALLVAASVATVEVGAAVAGGDLEDRSLAAERSAVDLSIPDRALNVARRSTFQWCPDVASARPFDDAAATDAAAAAHRFNVALIRGRGDVLAGLADHSVASLEPNQWGHTLLAKGIEITYSAPARDDGRAQMGCGTLVAQRSWKVVMHDASRTATAGLAAYYLVKRDDGWRVWGSYGGRRF